MVARGGKAARPRGGRSGRRSGVGIGLGVLLLLLMVPAALTAWSWWKLQRPYKGYEGPEKRVIIAPGTSTARILQILEHDGVLDDAKLARVYLIFRGEPKILAGEYLFKGELTAPQVLRMLVKGQIVGRTLTIIEGLTLEEIAEQLAAQGYGRREVFLDLMRSPGLIADVDPDAPDLEGYLFRKRFARDLRPLLARESPGRTVREVVTLASIVEKEAKAPDERPLIAAVYRNRLDHRIGLAADPTVIYALKRVGRWNGNIRREDLRMDSPYNTYRYAGLPPGPICSPGLASLTAAAAPAAVPYLYFVSRNDGTHVFARTLAEHNRNVDIWQRQYWRDRRAAGR